MRYAFVAATLASITAANPLVYRWYPTGGQPSSSPTPNSKPGGYGEHTPTPASTLLSSKYVASTPVSSSKGYEHGTSSSSSSLPGHGYSASASRSVGYPVWTPSSSVSSSPTPFSSKGYPGNTVPYGTGHSSKPEASTTDTGYSSKPPHGTASRSPHSKSHHPTGGYSHTYHPTGTEYSYSSQLVVTPTPSASLPPYDVTTTITTTTYVWVPCSTPVGSVGQSTVYSTFLTPSYTTHTITSTIYGCGGKGCASQTSVVPAPTPFSKAPVYPVSSPAPQSSGGSPSPPAGSPTPAGCPVPNCPAPPVCPAPATVTVTQYTPGGAHGGAPDLTTKTITITESGVPETYTVSFSAKPTHNPSSKKPHYPPYPTDSSPSAPVGTGHSQPTGFSASSAPYPTKKHDSSVHVYPTWTLSSAAPSATHSYSTKGYQVPSSSRGYSASSVASYSASTPVVSPSATSSTKSMPSPTGYVHY